MGANLILPAGSAAAAPADDYVVENSLKFEDGDGAYLSRTFGAGNQKTWTFSAWIKLGDPGQSSERGKIFTGAHGGPTIYDDAGLKFAHAYDPAGIDNIRVTKALIRDPSAWYHVVWWCDTTQSGTSGNDRWKIYVNGELQALETPSGSNGEPGYNTSITFNDAALHKIGGGHASVYFDGYLADIHFIDGTTKVASDFGETDSNGQWVPKEYTDDDYGTNGFHLPFSNTGGADVFVDSSSNTHTVTGAGNATHVRNDKKVGSSSIYFDGTGDKLTVPDSTDFDFGTGDFTIEFWAKWGEQDVYPMQFTTEQHGGAAGWNFFYVYLFASSPGTSYFYMADQQSTVMELYSTTAANDGNWHHFAFQRDTSASLVSLYVDGTRESTTSNTNADITCTSDFIIGDSVAGYNGGAQCHIDELRVSNTPRYSGTSFTDFGQDGGTISSPTKFSDDSNTLLLIHSDWNGGLFADASGKGNDFADGAGTFGSHDQMGDTPSAGKNYATFNPLDVGYSTSPLYSEGNLEMEFHYSSHEGRGVPTIRPSSGKWYGEFYAITTTRFTIGVMNSSHSVDTQIGATSNSARVNYDGTTYYNEVTSGSSYSDAFADGDIFQFALDLDNNALWFGINGTWQNGATASEIANGTTTNSFTTYIGSTSPITGGDIAIVVEDNSPSGPMHCIANFGQDPTFNNYKTSGQDSSQSEFYYAPPSGFKSLCTANLDAPGVNNAIAPAFAAVAYDDGAGAKTGLGFQPDLVWVKSRGSTSDHKLTDSVRGTTKSLESSTSDAEDTESTGLTAFGADGFTVGSDSDYADTTGDGMIAWAWKANGNTSPSANTAAGFSIVKWEGNDSGSGSERAIAHGLTVTPEMIIAKGLDDPSGFSGAGDWPVWHKDLSSGNTLYLNSGGGETYHSEWGSSSFGTSSFYVADGTGGMGGTGSLNTNSANYIAYCFASIEGYSKIGSYSRIGSASDSNFVYLGFRPRWLLMKKLGSASWVFYDTERTPYNELPKYLIYTSAAESSYTPSFDILSNGFKDRGFWGTDTSDYIYIAFGDSFKFSSAF